MKPVAPMPTHARPCRLAAVVVALALAGWALQSWLSAAEPARGPGVVLVDRALTDAALASPFGSGPAVLVAEAIPLPLPAAAPPSASAPRTADLPPPTLDASERAEARALLAQAGALDADSARELDALLYQDALQRFLALRDAGEPGDAGGELRALAAELRAGLPAREAAGDLPRAVLAQARAALQPATGSANPFGASR